MANFRVGQRVRIVAIAPRIIDVSRGALLGKEGVIVCHMDCAPFEWKVLVPSVYAPAGIVCGPNEWLCRTADLSPLTDPGAERFVESLKKLAREPRVERVSV